MKLIVLIVVSIAVFKASCSELPDGHDLTNGERVQHGTELRGKNGGSKCKSDIVCSLLGGSCVTNSTYCSGREVPSVCSGATCKCCIPVTLEVKVHDLETKLQAMVVNLTVENFNQRTKMDTIMNSLVSNLTIANANMLDFMISSNKNLTIANSDLKNELQVVKENLTIANSYMKNELQVIKDNVTRQGCPEGLFYFAPSSQCFLMLNDTTRSWYNADAACRAKGLVLAHPYDPVALRSYIVTRYSGDSYTWIGARGTGSSVKFQRSNRYINSNNPFWYSRTTSTSYCVFLYTNAYAMKNYGDRVYYSTSCSSGYWALCELINE